MVGIFFDGADVVNAVLYLAEGDWGNAALSGICALPLLGDFLGKAGKGTKYLLKLTDLSKLKRNEKVSDTLKRLDIFFKARRADISDLHKWIRKSWDDLLGGGGYAAEYVTPDGMIYRIRTSDDFRVNINLMDDAGDMLQDTLQAGKRTGNTWTKYTDDMKKFIIYPKDGYDAYLERIYIEIRKLGLDDIPIIAKNTGLSEDDLIKLKEHIFLKTHNLSVDGMPLKELYFQADSEIAYAWQKAMKGELTPDEKQWFKRLLDHELTESALMENGMPLRDPSTYGATGFNKDPIKNAHDKANLTAPQLGDFPGHNPNKDVLKYMDDKIDY